MRILQIIHGDEAGGVKTLAETIDDGLAGRGIMVETAILFPRPDARAKLAGVARVAWQILTGRYDAVIAYQSSASILTGIAGFLARCPRRIVHQTALPEEVRVSMRTLDRIAGFLGLYTANVVNSHATAAGFAHYSTRYRRSVVMIEHGVPARRPTRSREATLAAFHIPDGRILLNVGRLTAQKNQGVVIRALAHLPEMRLVIAGDGPARANYAALAAELGVADRLHMLGDVTHAEIADLFAATDLFVFPSTWETFGLAAVEAVLAGVPIVAADLPVLREVLSADGSAAAAFVAPFDTGGWVSAIENTRHNAAARAIVDAVAQRYSVPGMVDAYAALVRNAPSRGDAPLFASRPHGTGVA